MNPYSPKPWTVPPSWFGQRWDGWLVFMGRNRDSDLLTNHNFETAADQLDATLDVTKPADPTKVYSVRESHWACGWIEWFAIHPSNVAAVALANELADQLDAYPILDEDSYGTKEHEVACELWANMSVRERAEICRDARVSIFAARHPTMESDAIYDRMRDYAAE